MLFFSQYLYYKLIFIPEEHRIIGPDSLCSFLKVLMLKVQLAFTKYETFHFIF